jgi:quercetin dioxygenase-like cupin family protein
MRRLGLLLTVALVALGAVAAAATAMLAFDPVPAGPQGVHITPLSKGTIGSSVHAKAAGIEITTHGRKDILITAITVDAGGSFGWHTHPGPVLVAVASGTLSLYEPHHGRCPKRSVRAGHGFIEGGGDVHLARNEGSQPVQIYATFLARTGTTKFLTTVPEPAGCSI